MSYLELHDRIFQSARATLYTNVDTVVGNVTYKIPSGGFAEYTVAVFPLDKTEILGYSQLVQNMLAAWRPMVMWAVRHARRAYTDYQKGKFELVNDRGVRVMPYNERQYYYASEVSVSKTGALTWRSHLKDYVTVAVRLPAPTLDVRQHLR